MDEVIAQVVRLGTVALALYAYIATFFVRRIVETIWPFLVHKTGKPFKTNIQVWWNEVILHAVPSLFGVIIALFPSTFLFGEADTLSARVAFSAGIAWFSSFFYKVIKRAIQQRTGVVVVEDDDE